MANQLMRDALSPWTSPANRPLVAFDAAYYALLSRLPPELTRNTPDYPCPKLAGRGADALGLLEADKQRAIELARTRYDSSTWQGTQVISWARRILAASGTSA